MSKSQEWLGGIEPWNAEQEAECRRRKEPAIWVCLSEEEVLALSLRHVPARVQTVAQAALVDRPALVEPTT
jgi:hypothetical protein